MAKHSLLRAACALLFIGAAVWAYTQPLPSPGHGGNEIYIHINGSDKTLQEAIDNGDFDSSDLSGGSYSGGILFGHPGEYVFINVGGAVKSLQAAINDDSLTNTDAGTSPSSFGSVVHGHTGDEILVSILGSEKSLQQAINGGDFKYAPPAPEYPTCTWDSSYPRCCSVVSNWERLVWGTGYYVHQQDCKEFCESFEWTTCCVYYPYMGWSNEECLATDGAQRGGVGCCCNSKYDEFTAERADCN